MSFFDAFNEQQITGDVNYDLTVLDHDGNTVITHKDLTAKGGTDIQPINMPSNGVYRIQVNIKSIVHNGISDTSRTGLARGDLVIPSTVIPDKSILVKVPEFPFAGLVLIISTLSMILFYKMKSNI